MPDSDHTERIAAALLNGVEALRRGDPSTAVVSLQQVADDPVLAAATDLRDIRARALTLLAQALLGDQRVAEAITRVREALRLLDQLGDRAGVDEARTLHDEIAAAVEDRTRKERAAAGLVRLQGISVADLRAKYGHNPRQLLDVLLKKANAEVEAGRASTAAVLGQEVLEAAEPPGWVREVVLAHLTLARATPQIAAEHLHAAWTAAARANEPTLVGAVARAADAAGVAVARLHGPQMSDSHDD